MDIYSWIGGEYYPYGLCISPCVQTPSNTATTGRGRTQALLYPRYVYVIFGSDNPCAFKTPTSLPLRSNDAIGPLGYEVASVESLLSVEGSLVPAARTCKMHIIRAQEVVPTQKCAACLEQMGKHSSSSVSYTPAEATVPRLCRATYWRFYEVRRDFYDKGYHSLPLGFEQHTESVVPEGWLWGLWGVG